MFQACVLPKFGIEREVRVCDSCFDQYGPKEEEGSPSHEEKVVSPSPGAWRNYRVQGRGGGAGEGGDLPAEYLASPLSKQPQEPQPKQVAALHRTTI